MEWPRTFYLHLCLKCHEMYYGESISELATCPICQNTDQVRCQAVERYLKERSRE